MMDKRTKEELDREAVRIAYLIAGFIRHTLTKEEHDELDRWVEASDANMRLFEDLTDPEYIAEMYRLIGNKLN